MLREIWNDHEFKCFTTQSSSTAASKRRATCMNIKEASLTQIYDAEKGIKCVN